MKRAYHQTSALRFRKY